MSKLQRCPNCGSESIKLTRNKRGKVRYECDGNCWTATDWFWEENSAAFAWNQIKRSKAEPKPQTNADRIRAMSDECLAAWITGYTRSVTKQVEGCCLSDDYFDQTLDWLKQEVET